MVFNKNPKYLCVNVYVCGGGAAILPSLALLLFEKRNLFQFNSLKNSWFFYNGILKCHHYGGFDDLHRFQISIRFFFHLYFH